MLNINISKKHLFAFLVIVAIATVINYTIAQGGGGGEQSHPIDQLTGLDDGTCTDGTADNDMVDCADYAYDGPFASAAAFVTTNAGPGTTCTTACSNAGYSACAFGYKEVASGGYLLGSTDIVDCSATGAAKCFCWA